MTSPLLFLLLHLRMECVMSGPGKHYSHLFVRSSKSVRRFKVFLSCLWLSEMGPPVPRPVFVVEERWGIVCTQDLYIVSRPDLPCVLSHSLR
ncbi:hypothetical protein BDV97DRAFT_355905 [Delphinella strobiligena]|nr:hypothetical protein BDV97DRAFT_355905 [Delphinella strobiligena]